MDPKPDLRNLVIEWLTSHHYKYTAEGDSLSIDAPIERPTFTAHILFTSEYDITILKTGIVNLDDIKNLKEPKVTCSPAHKFEDDSWSMAIKFESLNCYDPKFFDDLLTVLSSPPSSSVSLNILEQWSEDDKNA